MTKTLQERFEKYVSPEPNTGCWLWTGTGTGGYGLIRYGRKMVRAHRVSWLLHRGDPGRLHVLHRCDVPACVNPDHLFLGTHAENMRDMAKKGRSGAPCGEQQGGAKLTAEKVREIRRMRTEGASYVDLAPLFGVSDVQVRNIALRRSWRSVL